MATRKLVEYLVDVARRKSCQVIFTTHSNDAIRPLPDDAVWAVSGHQLNQGKLDVASLRALTGEIETTCAIFTEDEFGRLVAEITLRSLNGLSRRADLVDLSAIDFYPLSGESQVLIHTRAHNTNPSIDFPVIGFLDGDMKERAHTSNDYAPKLVDHHGTKFYDLVFGPGFADPELVIVEDLLDNFADPSGKSVLGKLALGLNAASLTQKYLRETIEKVYHENKDPHLLFEILGEQLDYLDADFVARQFVTYWCLAFPEKVEDMWRDSQTILPTIPHHSVPSTSR